MKSVLAQDMLGVRILVLEDASPDNTTGVAAEFARGFESGLCKVKQMAFSALEVRTAAAFRRDGIPDPFISVLEITPEVLAGLGVNSATQNAALARRYLWSIGKLYNNGEYSVAFNVLTEKLLSCDWKQAEKRVIAGLRFLAAQLYLEAREICEEHRNRCSRDHHSADHFMTAL